MSRVTAQIHFRNPDQPRAFGTRGSSGLAGGVALSTVAFVLRRGHPLGDGGEDVVVVVPGRGRAFFRVMLVCRR